MTVLYQVTFIFVKTEYDQAKLESAFNSIGNWARLNKTGWYVWSILSPQQIYEILRHHIVVEDTVAIFAVDPNARMGWGPPWFWQWVDTKGAVGKNG